MEGRQGDTVTKEYVKKCMEGTEEVSKEGTVYKGVQKRNTNESENCG